MFVLESYPIAVAFCVVTMLCWGSWANTFSLCRGKYRFELFYWDYAAGVFLGMVGLSAVLGLSVASASRIKNGHQALTLVSATALAKHVGAGLEVSGPGRFVFVTE